MSEGATQRFDPLQPRGRARAVLLCLVVALFLLLLLPRMLGVGMFFDGVTYAAVARNLALGNGSFWQPHYTQTIYPAFHEQPPLGLWIQSLAFRLCGDSPRVESFYGLGMGLLLLLLLAGLWNALGMRPRSGAWFPILLLAVYPLTSWVLASNMLENTMAVFTTAAVWIAMLAVNAGSVRREIAGGALAGGLVGAALLTKGPVGLFPIVVPLLMLLAGPRRRVGPAIRTTVAMLGALALLGLLIASSPEARRGLSPYIERQLLAHLSGEKGHAAPSLRILRLLLLDSVVPLAVAGLLWLLVRRPRIVRERTILLPLAIAMAASLPILLSPYQMKWYLFPSLPFLALAVAGALAGAGEVLERRLTGSRTGVAAVVVGALLLCVAALLGMELQSGRVQKYREFHEELAPLAGEVPAGALISVCPASLESDWALVANSARHLRVSLTREPGHRYLLLLREGDCPVPPGYRPLRDDGARRYRMMVRD